MSGLFRPITASRHTAPPTGMAMGAVQEQQGAGRPFATFDLGEIVITDKLGHRFSDRQQ